MASDSVERERTWLVRRLPDPLPAGTPIAQGSLFTDGEVTVRVRRAGSRQLMAVEGRGRRAELEWDLSPDQLAGLWPLTRCGLEKVRHEVGIGSVTAEVDVFCGPLAGLVLVRVGFGDDASMAAFAAPDWFGDEVSDDPRYTDAALARDGLPRR